MSRVNGIAFGLALSIALGAVGCGSAEPRYGEASVSSGAPRITLTGTTFGEAAAMELAPGCPGYLDATVPGHVVHVQEALPFRVRATSNDAPLALAVAKGDEVRCDSDEGSGHAPSIALEGPGDYQIFVAALRSPAELAYEITIEASVPAQPGEPVAENGPREVSVTITSEPTGAEVRDSSGSVIGTTPAMFVLNVEPDQVGQERTFTLAMDGHSETQVTGALNGGALVLHGQLPVLGPTVIDEHSTESQPIRDYQTATMAIDVDESCSITDAEVGVNIHHSFVGDLRVVLQTPWNDEIMLQRHAGGGRRNLQRTWRTSERGSQLTDLIGRSTHGRWALIVHDDAGADTGTLDGFDLRLTCSPGGIAMNDPNPEPTPTNMHRDPVPVPVPVPQGNLPDLPTRTEIVRVLGALRPSAERCGAGTGGPVRVLLTVVGSTGRVSGVSSSGSASAAERACVERVVRGARFSQFRRQSLDVDYTYNLPARAAPQGGQVLDPWGN